MACVHAPLISPTPPPRDVEAFCSAWSSVAELRNSWSLHASLEYSLRFKRYPQLQDEPSSPTCARYKQGT